MGRSKALAFAVLLAATAACKNTSPLDPLLSQTTAGNTRIVNLPAELNFGSVPVGSTATRDLTITNSGATALTVQGITATGGTGTSGVSSEFNGATILAGTSLAVKVNFAPTLGQTYSTTLTVIGNQTAGTATVTLTGIGTVDHIPLFTRSGKGDAFFDLPTHISRIRITGHFVDTGGNSNFLVFWGQLLAINEILRTSDFDGILPLVGGGSIQIAQSPSIEWTFTEVR
jgi:hypothetical protein